MACYPYPHVYAAASTGPPKTSYFRSGSVVRDGFALDCGLFHSHAYIVREVKVVCIEKGKELCMVRVQSPWESGIWKGRWSTV